jgi:fucose permease
VIGASGARRSTSLLALLAFLSLGLPDGVLGVAWPSLRRSFALPMSHLGVLLAAAMVGYLGSSVASGALVGRLGLGRVLVASSVVSAASAVGYALAPHWGVVVASAVLAGLGAGAIDAGVNAFAAARLSPRVTTWLHASYGIGATLGPLLTGTVLTATGSWRAAYALVGIVLLVMAAGFARTERRWQVDPELSRAPRAAPGIAGTLREAAVWRSIGIFFVYAGLEVGIGQWAYGWLVEGRQVAPGVGAAWVAAYWGCLTAGRIGLGALTTRVRPETILRASVAGIPPGVLVLWAGVGPARGGAGLAILGLALAAIFPLLISATPDRIGAARATHAIGFQVAAFYVGTATLPGAAGLLVGRLGLDALGPFLLGTACLFAVLIGGRPGGPGQALRRAAAAVPR